LRVTMAFGDLRRFCAIGPQCVDFARQAQDGGMRFIRARRDLLS
jgi:hypothetical protein